MILQLQRIINKNGKKLIYLYKYPLQKYSLNIRQQNLRNALPLIYPNLRNIRQLSSFHAAPNPEHKDTDVLPTGEPELDKLYSKLEIELRGVDPTVLKSYSWFATTAAEHMGIQVGDW